MATLHIGPEVEPPTPPLSLNGWRREFCVELLGDGQARVFVRTVQQSSFTATELQRAMLFQHLDSRFRDLAGCVQSLSTELEVLADTARRTRPDRDNLFRTVEFDRVAWERVQMGVERWTRR